MPFVFLLVFALISFQAAWPTADWLDPYACLAAPWVLVLVCWLLAGWHARQFCRQLARHPSEHAWLWRRYVHTRRRQTLLATAGFLVLLFALGWGDFVRQGTQDTSLAALAELIQFAPFLVALILMWWQAYHAEAASHRLTPSAEPFIGRWTYLSFQVRHNLLLVVPPIVLTLVLRSFFAVFPALDNEGFLAAAGLVLAAGALISVPFILRVFLGLTPMPAGPLRDRLEAAARRVGFGFSNILVWDTRRSVANAMVSGALPWLRYVVLTDLLIERLTPDEVEAVFGHEVGHIKHHHMLLYIVFFIGSLTLMTGLWQFSTEVLQPALADAVPAPVLAATAGWSLPAEVAAGPVLLTVVAAYVFVVFGFLSRRCERQADLFGCRAVSPQAFIAALEKVADLNGIPRHRASWYSSWQHPTIAQRVDFVERVRDNPALEPRFQRSLLRLKLGLMSGLTVGLMVVMGLVAWQMGSEHVWDMFRVR
jgi:STE24 endopeptidase